jgi:hypothetical protein
MDLQTAKNTLARDIIEHVKSQVEQWKLVPWLALQADGRTGHLDRYSMAFYHGYWTLYSSSSGGLYRAWVDLDSGELVNPFWTAENMVITNEDLILSLSTQELDTDATVAKLREQAQKKTGSYYDPKEKEAWRQKVIAQTGLTERYERGKPREKLRSNWD